MEYVTSEIKVDVYIDNIFIIYIRSIIITGSLKDGKHLAVMVLACNPRIWEAEAWGLCLLG